MRFRDNGTSSLFSELNSKPEFHAAESLFQPGTVSVRDLDVDQFAEEHRPTASRHVKVAG